jgi:hypothetical protein
MLGRTPGMSVPPAQLPDWPSMAEKPVSVLARSTSGSM